MTEAAEVGERVTEKVRYGVWISQAATLVLAFIRLAASRILAVGHMVFEPSSRTRPAVALVLLLILLPVAAVFMVFRYQPTDPGSIVSVRPLEPAPAPTLTARLIPGKNTATILPPNGFHAGEVPARSADGKHSDRVAEPAQPASGPVSFQMGPPYTPINGRSFRDSSGQSVLLIGLEGPDRDALCLDDARALWACGLWARAALNNAIRGQDLTCVGDRSLPEPTPARCATRDGDLAAQLVRDGFARPQTEGDFRAEVTEARTARRGVWIGNWTIKDPPS